MPVDWAKPEDVPAKYMRVFIFLKETFGEEPGIEVHTFRVIPTGWIVTISRNGEPLWNPDFKGDPQMASMNWRFLRPL
jgi:hypothetical protein